MSVETSLGELRARLSLAEGSPTLLLAVAPSDAGLDEVRALLVEVLRAAPLTVADLGPCDSRTGPARWADRTKQRDAQAYVLAFVSSAPLETRAFAQLLNAERVLLRELGGPVVLLVSQPTEQMLRRYAHDFFTWVAQAYALPEPRQLRSLAPRLGVAAAAPACVEQPVEEPLRFLHLSDLHLRPDRVERYDQDRVLRGLLDYLERDREAFPLDLVFVTGDLAHGGRPEEYALVVDLLERLCTVTGVPVERLFVVPGNHDVDRNAGQWLLRTLGDDRRAIAFFAEPDGRRQHQQKLVAYEQSMRALLGPGRSLGLEMGADAVELVELRGTRLAVASFNSAWFSQDDGDWGKLWLGEPNVERALDRIADEEAAFAVALLHPPFEYLHELERDLVERWFERGVDLVLRGHLHSNRTRFVATQRGGYVEVAAPAAYQGSQWGNGCFMGEIRARARTVRLRPLRFASGPDPWVLDTTVFPDDAADGHCRTFAVPAKRRERSGVSVPRRAAVEAAYKKASVQQQERAVRAVREVRKSLSSRPEQDTLYELKASPSLRQEVLGQDDGVALVDAIERTEHPRTEITDFEGFKDVLLRACRLVRTEREALGIPQDRLTERSAAVVLAAALGVLVDAPIELEPRLEGGLRPDIVIGRGDARDVVEVAVHRSSFAPLSGQAHRIGEYLQRLPGRFGALAILEGSGAQTPGRPEIQQETTSAGRPVVVLIL
ncbi:MAG: metallophosphoesterase [Myxococcales bacterium]|nr:metallophosphoesterase [Myxococcales bacterium]